MKLANRLLLIALLQASTPLLAAEPQAPETRDVATKTAESAPQKLRAQELSDDFLGDVADGSKPAADGTVVEEESSDTMDQTLRVHTRTTP